MANSTGIVVTGGAVSFADAVLNDWKPETGVRIGIATVLAALVSAGLDRVMPGLGTGVASLFLLSVLLTSGPRLVKAMGLTS